MKLRTLLAGFACIALGACSDPDTHNGESTPIDSTNVNGTAPATYGADDPNEPVSPKYEGQYDTTLRANTASQADSMK